MSQKKSQNNAKLRAPKMPHMRHIKPEYSIHEVVNEMSIAARYAETYTWCHADIHGRFEWKPKTLKLHVLPFDDIDFESLMMEWVRYGFAERYEVDGQKYGRFINWEKHQHINKHETSEFPAPPAQSSTCENVPARASTIQIPSDSERESDSEIEKENESESVIPTNLPLDGGKVGALKVPSADAKTNPGGQEWRKQFQLDVQREAADKSIVFAVPFPEFVFEYVESLAKECSGLDEAQVAVRGWLEDRSFDGLTNPNVIWTKMAGEMAGIVANCRDEHQHWLRRQKALGVVPPTAAQIAEELLEEQS